MSKVKNAFAWLENQDEYSEQKNQDEQKNVKKIKNIMLEITYIVVDDDALNQIEIQKISLKELIQKTYNSELSDIDESSFDENGNWTEKLGILNYIRESSQCSCCHTTDVQYIAISCKKID